MTTVKMTQIKSEHPVNRICAGIDVHRDFACVSIVERYPEGDAFIDYRQVPTIKQDMIDLRNWLLEHNVSVVGVESTGKYWYSVYNALDGYIPVKVYNARHIKNLPGKKTDKSDSKWIAKVTLDETIRSSYIPPVQIRDARTLSRYRKSLVQERTRSRQQAHGLLESAGIKISSLVSDLFGTSGKNLMKLLISGIPSSAQMIEKSVRNQVRNKVPALMTAMDGYMRPTHQFTLKKLLESDTQLTLEIKAVEEELRRILLDTIEKTEIYERVRRLPGFGEISALLLLSEIGFDLCAFPSVKHFCSWAGVCPGSHESAGKSKGGKIENRQKYLRALMIEVSRVAILRKDTYIRAKYFNLKPRIGSSKATIAIAHKLLMAVYLAVKENKEYRELTAEYVSISQITKDKRMLTRITDRLGKETVVAIIETIESDDKH